jgi:hypothetical protein
LRVLSYEFPRRFENFLREQILARGVHVHFHSISELPKQFSYEIAFCWRGEDGLHIYLNTELDPDQAEVKAAHELAHEILVQEGYPAAVPSKPEDVQMQILASRLSSSVLNALVNRRISGLGFNLDAYDEMGIRALVRNTPENPDLSSMTKWENLVYNGLVYLDNYLDKKVNPRKMPELDAQAAFLKTIPGQWNLIEKMIEVAEAVGFEEPELCLKALVQLRDLLGLRGKVWVVDLRSGTLR